MAKSKEISTEGEHNAFLGVLKGTFWAISVSLLCVLVFAFIIKFTALSEGLISPINQGIKIISILIGAFVMSKKVRSSGWLWGIILGLSYTILAFVTFSILDGHFEFNISVLNDLLFGGIAGLIAGIIAFALKK